MRIALAVDTLADAGHQVALVCARFESADPRWEIVRLRRPKLLRFRRVKGFARAAEKALGDFPASVVFGDVPGGTVYLPHGGSWSAWRRQEIASSETAAEAKARARSIDRSPRQKVARELEEATLKHPRLKGVIALSHMVKDNLKYAAEYSGPLAVIPNGIVIPGGDLKPRPPGPPRILFAAHNFRLKGLAPFVRIVSRLKEVEGIVAGRGGAWLYRRLARRLGCADRIRFLGGEASMEDLYARTDILVQPTFYDPCSLTTLEALARGIPVVSSRFNGAAERILGGGAVVDDPRDDPAFAVAIGALLAKPEAERRAAALQAARGVSEPGTTARTVKQIEAWSA